MINIPGTKYILLSVEEIEQAASAMEASSESLEMAADALQAFVAEQKMLLEMITSQATSMQTLMGVNTAMVTVIGNAEDDTTMDELRENIAVAVEEFSA